MISLGVQAPRVLRARMWALNTCGEPNEIELTIRVLTADCAAPFSGGAGGAGLSGTGSRCGNGGVGFTSTITGTPVTYAGTSKRG